MPSRRLPDSNPKRYRALRMINDRKTVTPPAEVPVTPPTVIRFDLFFPAYKAKILAVAAALSAQGAATALVKAAKQLGAWLVDDFYEALQRAIRRAEFNSDVRALYGLELSETNTPKIVTEQDVLDWGENAHDGETVRTGAGGAPITFPSLLQMDTAVNDFKTKNLTQAAAKTTYDNAQQALETDNTEADKLILKCWNEIETYFDEGDKPSMRRQAREWGVVYIPRKGETLDPNEFSVKGKITDQVSGNGIEDAEIRVVETNETTLSESNGDYLVTYLTPGNYNLEITKPGYETETLPVTVVVNEITELDAELSPLVSSDGTVAGTVNYSGMPTAGIAMSIEGVALPVVLTDATGHYSISGIPAGMQTVRAQLPAALGGGYQTQAVNVINGAEVVANFNF
jgi:hypothetical protein